MSLTRRQFLLGTAAGFVLPSFYDKAFAYLENHGEPLLLSPRGASETLYACRNDHREGFELNLGDPRIEPPEMSIREFCLEFGEGDPERWWREYWLGEDDAGPVDMSEPMDFWTVVDWWCLKNSSNARAYHYLESLDLGPRLSDRTAIGGLDFICGAAPGVDYLGVTAIDELSLSFLQQRLNELGSGIAVKLF
jgi:hypothetical protein